MHVVSSFAARHPEVVWSYLSAAVCHVGVEARRFLGVTVLEELLEHHFARTFAALQREVAAGKRGLLGALSSTWFDDDRGPNYQLAQEYLASQGHPHGRRIDFASNTAMELPALAFEPCGGRRQDRLGQQATGAPANSGRSSSLSLHRRRNQ